MLGGRRRHCGEPSRAPHLLRHHVLRRVGAPRGAHGAGAQPEAPRHRHVVHRRVRRDGLEHVRRRDGGVLRRPARGPHRAHALGRRGVPLVPGARVQANDSEKRQLPARSRNHGGSPEPEAARRCGGGGSPEARTQRPAEMVTSAFPRPRIIRIPRGDEMRSARWSASCSLSS